MLKTKDDAKKVMAETAKEIYEDGLKSTVKSSGNVLSLIPRAINAALSGVEKWILNKEYSLKEAKKKLEYKLENFDPSKIEEPEAYVAVPAINALSYSYASDDLIDLYSNLLASSMISDAKWKVHPSFVEIIKQLSPDEAKLLKHLVTIKCDNEYPLINLCMERKAKTLGRIEMTSYIYIRNFSNIGYGVCDYPEHISKYIDNLVRLNIVEIIESMVVTDYDYSEIENHWYITDYKNKTVLRDGFDWNIKTFMFMITDFGKSFIDVCVIPPKNDNDSH